MILAAAAVFIFSKNRTAAPNNILETPQPAAYSEPEVIAENLAVPWDLDFLPSGEILVTERPGNLLVIKNDKTVIRVEGVHHTSEGGLMGIAIHPDFGRNNWIYLYFTSNNSGRVSNRVERYKLEGNRISDKKVILENIPASPFHDGGQVEFGPDKYLYIATGDAGQGNLAQDKNSLAGKILRLTDEGSIPDDNPFNPSKAEAGNPAVYSYGHRNPQGLTWDDADNLWITEHGPSGIDGGSGQDEVNRIEQGKNYGWPEIKGAQTRSGMESPAIQSGTAETWAPASAAFSDGQIIFAGLRGEIIYAFDITSKNLRKYFAGKYGRLRAVKIHDGELYFTTSNTDGRGSVRSGDDKLLKVKVSAIINP